MPALEHYRSGGVTGSAARRRKMTGMTVHPVDVARRIARSSVRRFRRGWRPSLTRTARLTGAAGAAYVAASMLLAHGPLHAPRPLLAALTALLVVQATLVGTLSDSLKRIASVIAGVAVAIAFSSVVGFSLASLVGLIAAALVVGQILRLGPHLLEVPISAMLVLNVGAAESAAAGRIVETVIGAVVGLLVNLAFPPAMQTRTVGAAVADYAGRLAGQLETVAEEITEQLRPDQADQWLSDARDLTDSTTDLDRLIGAAEQNRRLNPRALGRLDAAPDLRADLGALEHSAVALRALYRTMADRARAQEGDTQAYGGETRQVFGVLLQDLATAVRQFGSLIRAEDEQAGGEYGQELEAALDSVREARARLTELLLVDPRDEPGLWALHGSLLTAVERVLRELDVEERNRARARRSAERTRTPAAVAVDRLRTATRQVAERPRRPRR